MSKIIFLFVLLLVGEVCLAEDRDLELVAPDSTIKRYVGQVLSSINDKAIGAAKGVAFGCSEVGETAKNIAELRDKGTGRLSAKIQAKVFSGMSLGLNKIMSYMMDSGNVAVTDIHEKTITISGLNTASGISASAFSDSSELVDTIYNNPGLSEEDLKILIIYGCLLRVGFGGR